MRVQDLIEIYRSRISIQATVRPSMDGARAEGDTQWSELRKGEDIIGREDLGWRGKGTAMKYKVGKGDVTFEL